MKIIALIPTFGTRPYLSDMLKWLEASKDVSDVMIKTDTVPRGPAAARAELVTEAFAKHGKDAIYLMLDDDCIFSNTSRLADAARHFEEIKGLGIVGIPLKLQFLAKGFCNSTKAYHCFMVSGSVLANSINYTPGEFCEDIDFSFRTWLAGYKIISTQRAEIWHHTTSHKDDAQDIGVAFENYKNKTVQVGSTFLQRMDGLVTAQTHNMLGIELPKFFSVKETEKAKQQHIANKKY